MLLLTKQLKGVREIIVSRRKRKDFEVVTEEWLKYKKNTVKKSTYYNYSYSVAKYLYPSFAGKNITKIKNYNNFIEELSDTLSPKTVRDIVTKLKEIINLYEEEHNTKLNIKKMSLPKMNKKEIQILSNKEKQKLEKYCIEQNSLKDMVRKTIFAVSTEENRPIFTGCLFEIRNNKVNVVAVDGFRLAWKSKFLQTAVNDFSAVIPGRTLNEINKILNDSFDTIKIGVSKNQALFEMENCKIVTRLLDGEFLNYASVIPETWETRIRVDKGSIQNCFERVSLISASSIEKEKKYPVKVNIEIGKVTISCTNQTGDAKEEIFVESEGKNLEAGFNPKYFLDALRAIDDPEVFIDFGSSISPCIIRPTEENGDYIYMVLPIRMKE